VAGWLTAPVPRGRVAALRTLAYLFVAADLVHFTPWVRTHASVPGELYRPLLVGRLLPLPTPTPALVTAVFWALLGLSVAAAAGRAPRALGWPVFALYAEWMVIAMSYGKVDHDRFAFLVLLAVLPTAGPARHGDPRPSEAGGWALRVTQLAVVATYFLAAWAKLRFGGLEWATGSTLARAIIRRGTGFGDAVARVPGLLVGAQTGTLAFELSTPLIFVLRGRWRYAAVGVCFLFHAATFATITILFPAHLAAMASFLPLERVRPLRRLRVPARLHRTAASRRRRSRPEAGRGAGPPTGTPATRAPAPDEAAAPGRPPATTGSAR
jgi:hypothetical protein